jgi:GTP-binding protein HflX
VDISSSDFEEKMHVVEELITKLNLKEKKLFVVFNKIDRIDRTFLDRIENRYRAVSISCKKNEGIERLIQTIEMELYEEYPKIDNNSPSSI